MRMLGNDSDVTRVQVAPAPLSFPPHVPTHGTGSQTTGHQPGGPGTHPTLSEPQANADTRSQPKKFCNCGKI